ncbi:MAG TPA: SpoIVB peptidase S55 [Terracidiphilus sp.]|nr:SpoIVB peptidase S55 [Terracidiphilus sp.]
MNPSHKEIVPRKVVPAAALAGVVAALLAATPFAVSGQTVSGQSVLGLSAPDTTPPPSTGGFYPLKDVHRGQMATAWTVFTGTRPEPMQVEILGVMRGARGPGHDMILAQLHGAKPEYTGVVAGMSGSPVYIGDKLVGSLSFRIGQFSKDPIAGITPIEQMLEVRDLPVEAAHTTLTAANSDASVHADGMEFQAMDTPLVMSGFRPEAIAFWQKEMAGTGLELVAAGGVGGGAGLEGSGLGSETKMTSAADVVPGSAVSAQLVRGDLDISATCTVTYIDPKQLLACGHPIMQAGPVSMPMTKAEVLTTLASPLNAFKIINTGDTIGAFTQDRDAAIRGEIGVAAHMIPVHVAVHEAEKTRTLNFDVVDMPSLTPQAVTVALYDALLENNDSTADTSYHVTGDIALEGYPPSPVDLWVAGGDGVPAQLTAAVLTGQSFLKLYSNNTRQGAVRSINIAVESIPRNLQVALEDARIVSGDLVHAGDRVVIEATLRPWQQPARNVRIPITLPARLQPGTLRVLVSDAGTLDRALNQALDQPRNSARPADLETSLAQARRLHPADKVYVSLLTPETQAELEGRTLTGLPLSMANTLETLRAGKDVALNGESATVAGEAPAGGVLSGFAILDLHIDDGGGLH